MSMQQQDQTQQQHTTVHQTASSCREKREDDLLVYSQGHKGLVEVTAEDDCMSESDATMKQQQQQEGYQCNANAACRQPHQQQQRCNGVAQPESCSLHTAANTAVGNAGSGGIVSSSRSSPVQGGGSGGLGKLLQHAEAIEAELSALLPAAGLVTVEAPSTIASEKDAKGDAAADSAAVGDGNCSSTVVPAEVVAAAADCQVHHASCTAASGSTQLPIAAQEPCSIQQPTSHHATTDHAAIDRSAGAPSLLAAAAAAQLGPAPAAAAVAGHVVPMPVGAIGSGSGREVSPHQAAIVMKTLEQPTNGFGTSLSNYLTKLIVSARPKQQQQPAAVAVPVPEQQVPVYKPSANTQQQQQQQQLEAATMMNHVPASVQSSILKWASLAAAAAGSLQVAVGNANRVLLIPTTVTAAAAAAPAASAVFLQQQQEQQQQQQQRQHASLTRLAGSTFILGRATGQQKASAPVMQQTAAAAAAQALAASAAAAASAHMGSSLARQPAPAAVAAALPCSGVKRRSSEETTFHTDWAQQQQQHRRSSVLGSSRLSVQSAAEPPDAVADAPVNKKPKVDIARLLGQMSAVVEASYGPAAANRAAAAAHDVLQEHGYMQGQQLQLRA